MYVCIYAYTYIQTPASTHVPCVNTYAHICMHAECSYWELSFKQRIHKYYKCERTNMSTK